MIKNNWTIAIFLVLFVNNIFAQDIIKLPAPDKTGGKPLMQALNERGSNRNFTDKDLTDQQLSGLLWAAYGINRAEPGKHTAPTSQNKQDIELYVLLSTGHYLYLPAEHALKQLGSTDIRAMAGKQDYVKLASVNIVFVSDFEKLGGSDNTVKEKTAATHCGFIGQNIYLYCASEGLISVFRASLDKDILAKTLGLPENKHIIYAQSAGYASE